MAAPLISARRPTTLRDLFCIMCLSAMFCRLPRWLIANGLLDLRDERLCVAHDRLPFFLADGHDHHPIGPDAVDKERTRRARLQCRCRSDSAHRTSGAGSMWCA